MNLLGCLALNRSPETGIWYRAIQPQFWQTSLATTQTKLLPSRFNEGNAARPQFEVLYLAETQMVSLFEVQALFGSPTQPGGVIANPRRPWTVINVQVQLQDVADLTQVSQQMLLATTAQTDRRLVWLSTADCLDLRKSTDWHRTDPSAGSRTVCGQWAGRISDAFGSTTLS